MSESNSHFADLVPMRVRQDSVQSNVADYLQHEATRTKTYQRPIEIDGTISGMDVSAQLGCLSNADGDLNAMDVEYNEALERFMRNEIAYDEFMGITGGVGLNEEAADFDDSILDDEFEEPVPLTKRQRSQRRDPALANDDEDVEDDARSDVEENEAGPSTSAFSPLMRPLSSVPVHPGSRVIKSDLSRIVVTAKNGEEIDEDRLLGIPLELRNSGMSSDQAAGRNTTKPSPMTAPQRNKLNKTLDALLGQANVIYARGQTKEALTMLLEVIRQEPRSPDAYRLVADIYKEMNQPHKSLQYGLLAAHLNNRTPADEWVELGDLAQSLQRIEEAAACYGRALRVEPTNWKHYEKRIETLDMIGLRPVAMKTRLLAAQNIDHSSAKVDFDWFQTLIKTVAEYYVQLNDEEKAIMALEAFVLRSREFGKKAETQHQTLVGWFLYVVFVVLVVLLSHKTLVDKLFEREVSLDDEQLYLDIARAYQAVDCTPHAQKYMEHLLARRCFAESADVWFLYGQLLSVRNFTASDFKRMCFKARKKPEAAATAYERVLELQPSHVDARINLSTVQQRLGMAEKAFETLRDYDLDAGSSLPVRIIIVNINAIDERLLIRQADFLSERKRIDQFVRCVRMLLTPHFYMVHQQAPYMKKRLPSGTRTSSFMVIYVFTALAVCHGLRKATFYAVRGSALEKFVKRLGAIAASEDRPPSEITANQLHDYAFKLIEILVSYERFADALHVCCYAYLQPTIGKTSKTIETFLNLLMFLSIKAQYWPLTFVYLRWYHTVSLNNKELLTSGFRDLLFTRIFNAMNHVFCHSQNVSYHRFVMRASARMPGNIALQMISGNNSLITGAYRHALGEYLRVWFRVPDNPLACMLIALTFTHMACKKDISSRHMVALRVSFFLFCVYESLSAGAWRVSGDELQYCENVPSNEYSTWEGMSSAPSDHEWELNRENIRPLRGGRSVNAINNIFGGAKASIEEADSKFESVLVEAEESSDPLEVCTKYVAWFEEHFPTGKQSHLYPKLTRIINKYGYRESYLNDERMLKMWFKLAENRGSANPEALFERAYTAGCCLKMAKFYIRWAELREDMHDVDGARSVLNRARENGALPLSLLNEASDEFEMRQLRLFTQMDIDSDTDTLPFENPEPMRIALGGLRGLGRNQRTPAIRETSEVASGLRSGGQQQPSFAIHSDEATSTSRESGNAFLIYEGNEVFDEQNVLVPQDFGDDLGRVEFAENSKEPSKWNEARIKGTKKATQSSSAHFEVCKLADHQTVKFYHSRRNSVNSKIFDEIEYKKQKKERKEREKAMSKLLIRDLTISAEELFAMDIEQKSPQNDSDERLQQQSISEVLREMFVLALMEDTVRIKPHNFGMPFEEVCFSFIPLIILIGLLRGVL
ncbi:unnamed protein product [Anisakis simplex]|uniref:General transcription factor 3C polypeptide 3 (inferred by orthology to a human protein) n=1 Tax=Anisakis simplex TaxID=6269 RepID=A0A0M3K477_ANISI|nr:unnamed protein product [Anisakis simplex]